MLGSLVSLLVLTGSIRSVDLENLVKARLDGLPARSTAHAKHLPSGREIEVRADEPVNTVSVIKLAIMVLAYRESEAGRLSLDERHTLTPEEMRRGTGVLQGFAPGLSPTFRDLVNQMIVTSDNTATDVLVAKLGLARVNEMLKSLGYAETRLQMTIGALFRGVWEAKETAYRTLSDREVFERGFPDGEGVEALYRAYVTDSSKWLGRTTARETSRLLESLQKGELAGPRSTEEMLETLKRQLYFSRLPQRIRSRVVVGHKTGDWPPLIGNDVGIVYAKSGPIVVSIFTNDNRGDFFELEATLGRIAEDLLFAWGSEP